MLQTQSRVTANTLGTAQAVLEIISSAKSPIGALDICKEFNLPKGRHPEVSHALKYLRKHDKIDKLGSGKRGIRYTATNGAKLDSLLTPAEKAEQTAIAPVPKVPRARLSASVLVEVPRATLKVLVKAVMANCSPMEGVLQRAVLQCMEKLI
jgi:hypothetical protein